MKSLPWSLLAVLHPLFCLSCQSSSADDPVTDTNTNWLERCESNETCGDLACLCGVCTRECEMDADCSGLGDGATCQESNAPSCERGAMCVAATEDSDDDTPGPSAGPEQNTGGAGPAPEAPASPMLPPEPAPAMESSPCSGEPPLCNIACGTLGPGSCENGTWVCPPPLALPCPTCEGEPLACDDGCGGTTPSACVNGVWMCPTEQDTGCPVPPTTSTAGAGGTGGAGAMTEGGAGGGLGGSTSVECEGPCPELDAGSGATGGESAQDAGGETQAPCETAVDGEPCPTEGTTCGECTNACAFCNLMRCQGGSWLRVEAPPAPVECFECGLGVRCELYQNYCLVEFGAVYSCEPLPDPCVEDPTCDCITTDVPDATCTESNPGGLVLESTGGE